MNRNQTIAKKKKETNVNLMNNRNQTMAKK